MPPPLLTLQGINLSFGGTPLLNNAELSISRSERLCLVGRNGSGKSTLLKIAAGLIEPDQGERFVQPGTTVRYLHQEPDLSAYDTSLDYILSGLGPSDEPYRAQYLAEQLGLTGQENPKHLSGGEARRAALAHVLAPQPDILFLDEPTNHLDLPAIEWLEQELNSLQSALVLISHDRRFLEHLSKTTVWLDRGMARHLNRGFSHFEAWRDEVLKEEAEEQHKLARKIVMEEDWLRYGVTARRKRNQKRLANLHALRDAKKNYRGQQGAVKLTQSSSETAGKLIIEAQNITKRYDTKALVKNFSLRIQRGEKIGIIGPNGAGKTTLLKMLTGQLEPDEGTVRLGANLQMVTLEQKRDSLNPTWSLKDALTGGSGDLVEIGSQTKHVFSYMKDFLFSPEQANTPISVLSGGERARIMLARALAQPSNLLILDEPTNDLDLETLDLLQEMLSDYSDTVLLVSHDRDFLDRVVTSVIAFEDNGQWIHYAGGYSDMLLQKKQQQKELSPKQKDKPSQSAKQPTKATSQNKRKLSYKEKYALETLPEKMATLEQNIADYQTALEDPELYTKDAARFQKLSHDLERAQKELFIYEEQWLELEILREKLETES